MKNETIVDVKSSLCSSIVIITCIVVAATSSAISKKFGAFSFVGAIIGSAVSATFLLVLGAANAYVFLLLVRKMRKVPKGGVSARDLNKFKLEGGGCLFHLMKRMFKLIDR